MRQPSWLTYCCVSESDRANSIANWRENTNHVLPYFRAPHLLLGFPMRYVERGWNPSMRFLPDLRNRKVRLAAHPRYATALTETQLMASRDGVAFKLWNEAFSVPIRGTTATTRSPGTW